MPVSAMFDEQADYEKGFGEYYAQHISPCLDKLEEERLSDYNQFAIVAGIGCGIFALVVIVLFFAGSLFNDPGMVRTIDGFSSIFSKHSNDAVDGKLHILFFVGFLASIWPGIIYKRYAHNAKAALLPSLLKFFGDIAYFPETALSPYSFADFSILPSFTSFESDDHIGGCLDEVGFSLAELKLVQGSGKNRTTAFRGITIKLEMNKRFQGKTIVKKHTGFLGGPHSPSSELKTVTLEDVTFAKLFDVYSDEQVEARYVLTTAFMERLMQLGSLMQNWGSKKATLDLKSASSNISCSFHNNSLLLMVPCSIDMFQPGTLFKSAYNEEEIHCMLRQIYLIRGIIETLKLNERRGLLAGAPVADNTVASPWKAAPVTAPVSVAVPAAAQPAATQPAGTAAPVHHAPPADEW